ncbi:MAG: UDP-2,3-diacylglucosamine diphosphatase, partial [Betaproteobacteria bacterium]|nr:UDP-2,3-diacylglucosamine diphosphatase [Betaproteobacteria bacterium]
MASSLFISDLHLSEERPAANEAFFAFVEEKASAASALYILGDLFEYW